MAQRHDLHHPCLSVPRLLPGPDGLSGGELSPLPGGRDQGAADEWSANPGPGGGLSGRGVAAPEIVLCLRCGWVAGAGGLGGGHRQGGIYAAERVCEGQHASGRAARDRDACGSGASVGAHGRAHGLPQVPAAPAGAGDGYLVWRVGVGYVLHRLAHQEPGGQAGRHAGLPAAHSRLHRSGPGPLFHRGRGLRPVRDFCPGRMVPAGRKGRTIPCLYSGLQIQ